MIETKYIVLKLQDQFDIVKLRDKLNEIIGPDNSTGIAMKWLDIADELLDCEYTMFDYKLNQSDIIESNKIQVEMIKTFNENKEDHDRRMEKINKELDAVGSMSQKTLNKRFTI